VAEQVLYVALRACKKIVRADHFVPSVDQAVDKV
jgi:hypothetical protein